MSVIKPFFEGLGTGAGVAWPLFGILSSSLSLGIGGTLILTLGAFCSSVFFVVSIPVFYFAYQNHKEEEKKLKTKFSTLLNELNSSSIHAINQFKLQGQQSMIGEMINSNQSQKDQFYSSFIAYLMHLSKREDFFDLPEKERSLIIRQSLIRLLNYTKWDSEKSLSRASFLRVGFLGFVGAFGSVAGCSAGLMGFFMGLGLLSGFAAVPVLGMIILISAVACGVYTAMISVDSAVEKTIKKQLCKNIKELNSSLGTIQLSKVNNEISNPDDALKDISTPLLGVPPKTQIFVNPAEIGSCLFMKKSHNTLTYDLDQSLLFHISKP